MDWVLSGSRPPSVMSSRPSSAASSNFPSSRPGSSLYTDNVFRSKNQKFGQTYADRLFGPNVNNNLSTVNSRPPSTYTPDKVKAKLGDSSRHLNQDFDLDPTPMDDQFEALWTEDTNGSLKNSFSEKTNYSSRNCDSAMSNSGNKKQTGKQDTPAGDSNPPSSRSTTPSKITSINYGRRKFYKSKPTYVDETLFGSTKEEPGFTAPWDCDKKTSKANTFNAKIEKGTVSRPASATSCRNSPAPKSHVKYKAPRQHHKETYVDESLFEKKPKEPDFAAPWDKEDKKKTRPLMFSPSDYCKLEARPKSATPKKPVWK